MRPLLPMRALLPAVRPLARRLLSSPADSRSIFSPDVSPWDNIFHDIKDTPPPLLATRPSRHLKHSYADRPGDGKKKPRAVAMTHVEACVFDQMFQSIFSKSSPSSSPSNPVPAIGQHKLTSLYQNLRDGSRRRGDAEPDQELDRKKEEMELCESDLQLLEWAMREVFGESQRYEEAARRAAHPPPDNSPQAPPATPSASSSSSPTSSSPPPSHQPLQPPSYPHLLAALMRTFRDKYKDPHLALAMFDHARNLSIASYVFGCTTPVYNELIETRWRCFRDVRGVCDALAEMRVNAVRMDSRTRLLGETIRREVGERSVWQEESSLGSGEVFEMIARIERLTTPPKPKRSTRAAAGRNTSPLPDSRKRSWKTTGEEWKKNALDANARDGWGFDQWRLP